MHKIKDQENPGLPVGNPIHYHFTTCVNIETERRSPKVFSLLNDSFDPDDFNPEDFMSELNNEHTPGRDKSATAPSNEQSSSDVLVTPRVHTPFVPVPSTAPYNWLHVDPDLDF